MIPNAVPWFRHQSELELVIDLGKNTKFPRHIYKIPTRNLTFKSNRISAALHIADWGFPEELTKSPKMYQLVFYTFSSCLEILKY